MKRILLVGGVQLLAFWEVWIWYVSRAIYSWDQPWGLLAFAAAFVFLFASRKPLPQQTRSLLLPAALIALYIATYLLGNGRYAKTPSCFRLLPGSWLQREAAPGPSRRKRFAVVQLRCDERPRSASRLRTHSQ